jgi:excisionase family DNA binding protein
MNAAQRYNNATSATQQPIPFNQLQLDYMQTVFQTELQNCLWYRVQCTDVAGAAQLLKVEPCTIRHWIAEGKLEASKMGNAYQIRLQSIEKMLQRNAVAPVIKLDKRHKIHNQNK